MSGSGISWDICKSASRSRQITMPAPHCSVFCRPNALPAAQPTVSKHWRQKSCIQSYSLESHNLDMFSFVYESLKNWSAWISVGIKCYNSWWIQENYILTDVSCVVVLLTRNVVNFQVCRNINRIKVCMETGQTVILLNLENLYESLYDALNQVWTESPCSSHLFLFDIVHVVYGKVSGTLLGFFVDEKPVLYW